MFIQYVGDAAKVAKLSAALEQAAFQVPPEQEIPTAADRAEVRYFYDDDAGVARAVGDTVAKFLGRAIATKDASGWVKARPAQAPPQGTLEVWIDLSGS